MPIKTLAGFLILFSSFSLYTQPDSLSIEEQLELLELEMDSLMVYNLINSILSDYKPTSEVGFRIAYNSSVTNAGRTYSLDQHGFSPGISYYHKSGVFGDVSGFWGSALDPKYSLTVGTLGYMKLLGKNWSISGNYERWFYNYDSSNPPNTLGATMGFTSKYFYSSLDYSFLFGQETSNRVILSASGNLKVQNWWKFKSVTFRPTISTVYGNQDVTILFSDMDKTLEERRTYIRENLDREELDQFAASVLSEEDLQEVVQIKNDRLGKKGLRIAEIYSNYPEIGDYIDQQLATTVNSYGFMNISFGLPIQFAFKKFSVIASYTYNIPIRLPEETGTLSPVGYFGLSVNYRIPLR